jgi:hypothetical protein
MGLWIRKKLDVDLGQNGDGHKDSHVEMDKTPRDIEMFKP